MNGMKCLRCGYCCVSYDVIVPLKAAPENPNEWDNGMEEYAKHKPTGEACWNLIYDIETREASCLIHDEDFFADSPCDQFGQIERKKTDVCRMGEYILNRKLSGAERK